MSLVDDLAIARNASLDRKARNLRILTIDIETKPMLVYSWGLWRQNHSIDQIVDDGGIICFAAKWFGEKEVIFASDHADGHEGMLRKAWELLTEADVVITYNGDNFDIPRLNQEFMLQGWGPAAPFKSVDLIRTNRRRFQLPSRKLDYLAQRSGTGAKVKHQGFDLWIGCLAGDDTAWATMEKYNRGDVTLTERVYLRLLPWMTTGPHFGLLLGGNRLCPYCGSAKVVKTGKPVHAFAQTYSLLRCQNCTGWSRDVFRIHEPNFTRAVR